MQTYPHQEILHKFQILWIDIFHTSSSNQEHFFCKGRTNLPRNQLIQLCLLKKKDLPLFLLDRVGLFLSPCPLLMVAQNLLLIQIKLPVKKLLFSFNKLFEKLFKCYIKIVNSRDR